MPLDERIEDWKSSNLANTDFAVSEMEKDIKRIREKIDSLEFLLEEQELLLIDQTALEVAVLLGYLDYRAENTKNIDQFIKSKFQEVVKELKEKKYL